MPDKARFLLALALAWGFVLLSLAATALLAGRGPERRGASRWCRRSCANAPPMSVVAALLLLVPLAFVLRVAVSPVCQTRRDGWPRTRA